MVCFSILHDFTFTSVGALIWLKLAILDADDLNFKNSLSLKNIKGAVNQLLNLS